VWKKNSSGGRKDDRLMQLAKFQDGPDACGRARMKKMIVRPYAVDISTGPLAPFPYASLVPLLLGKPG
jgi:hypothetical protein